MKFHEIKKNVQGKDHLRPYKTTIRDPIKLKDIKEDQKRNNE